MAFRLIQVEMYHFFNAKNIMGHDERLKASPEDVKGLPFGEPRNHNSTRFCNPIFSANWKRGSR